MQTPCRSLGTPVHVTQTAWGGASLVDAAKVLLRAALLDRTNQKFVLLSESCTSPQPACDALTCCEHVAVSCLHLDRTLV